MANNALRSEHPTPPGTRHRTHVKAAQVLLRQALGRHAAVEWIATDSADGSDVVSVQWRGSEGPPRRLRLVPRSAPSADAVLVGRRATADEQDEAIVWVVPRSTAARRAAWRKRGEQFVDLSGTVRLDLPWAIVDRNDLRPVRTAESGATTDPFADRSSLVVRTLMEAHGLGRVWGVRELAAAADVGVSTTSEVLKALEARRLVAVDRSRRTAGVRLRDPSAVLEAWARAYDWHQNRQLLFNAPVGDPARFLRRLPDLMHPRYRWALTLQAGASLIAPHATWDRVHIYVDVPAPDRADWRHALASVAIRAGWPSGPEGRVVLMTPYYETSAWYGLRTVRDLPVVSDLQLALDLWHYPLRGREQAEHLVEHAFRPRPAAAGATGPARDVLYGDEETLT